MSNLNNRVPFTFAEIVVGAPWATSLLADIQDNDKGNMLHRNNPYDEWWGEDRPDVVALEYQARRMRAATIGDGLVRLGRHLAAILRHGRAHP
jgi:hypothetical protein